LLPLPLGAIVHALMNFLLAFGLIASSRAQSKAFSPLSPSDLQLLAVAGVLKEILNYGGE
jgi:hypothetical protein